MKYQTLLVSGLAALVLNSSCKYEKSVGTPNTDGENVVVEAYTKPVIFQESDVMPLTFISEELQNTKVQYQKVMANLTRLYSMVNGVKINRGTGCLVNPMQMLTAHHVTKSPSLEYVVQDASGKEQNISTWIRNIDSNTVADIAVINLQTRVVERPSLQFYDKPIEKGLAVALLAYNNDRRVIREGEIIKVYTKEGREKFETNIAVIPGNSGGVYVDQAEGKIVGVLTNGSSQLSLGPSIRTLDIQKRERVLSADEQKRVQLYKEVQEFEQRKAGLGYEDFARGDFYLGEEPDYLNVKICLSQKVLPLVEPRCFRFNEFSTVKATRASTQMGEGREKFWIAVKFRDGRIYERERVSDVQPGEEKRHYMATSISGEW